MHQETENHLIAAIGNPESERIQAIPNNRDAALAFQLVHREELYCPTLLGGCGAKLTARVGTKRVPHLAHRVTPGERVCSIDRDMVTHRAIQEWLVRHLRSRGFDADLEVRHDGSRLRSDLVVTGGSLGGYRLGLEIQLSPQDSARTWERSILYRNTELALNGVQWLSTYDARHLKPVWDEKNGLSILFTRPASPRFNMKSPTAQTKEIIPFQSLQLLPPTSSAPDESVEAIFPNLRRKIFSSLAKNQQAGASFLERAKESARRKKRLQQETERIKQQQLKDEEQWIKHHLKGEEEQAKQQKERLELYKKHTHPKPGKHQEKADREDLDQLKIKDWSQENYREYSYTLTSNMYKIRRMRSHALSVPRILWPTYRTNIIQQAPPALSVEDALKLQGWDRDVKKLRGYFPYDAYLTLFHPQLRVEGVYYHAGNKDGVRYLTYATAQLLDYVELILSWWVGSTCGHTRWSVDDIMDAALEQKQVGLLCLLTQIPATIYLDWLLAPKHTTIFFLNPDGSINPAITRKLWPEATQYAQHLRQHPEAHPGNYLPHLKGPKITHHQKYLPF